MKRKTFMKALVALTFVPVTAVKVLEVKKDSVGVDLTVISTPHGKEPFYLRHEYITREQLEAEYPISYPLTAQATPFTRGMLKGKKIKTNKFRWSED